MTEIFPSESQELQSGDVNRLPNIDGVGATKIRVGTDVRCVFVLDGREDATDKTTRLFFFFSQG